MPTVARILVALLLAVAVPLRAYAAVSMSVCEMHHSAAAGPAAVHAQSADQPQDPHDHESNGAVSTSGCNACAGCCVGPSQAPDAVRLEPFAAAGADRIPYLGKQVPVRDSDRLDRPPLVL